MDILLLPGYYITESDNLLILYPFGYSKKDHMTMDTNTELTDHKWQETDLDMTCLLLLNTNLMFDYIGPL